MDDISIEEARNLLMEGDVLPMTPIDGIGDSLGAGDDGPGKSGQPGALGEGGGAGKAGEPGEPGEPGGRSSLGESGQFVQPGGAEGAGEGVPEAGSRPGREARSYVEGSVGLGVDIVEIERMKSLLARQPHFAERVFSPEERAYCDKAANPATHYALRFAAKEAVVKALGTGFADGIWVRDIEVERAKNGKPTAKLSGRALEAAESRGVRDLSLSLSYTRTDAVACAMAVTESALRATEKRKDPMEELARQFKETRKMLDEL